MDKLCLIASMAATLEAGDRANANVAGVEHAPFYAYRAYDLYQAALDEIRDRDETATRNLLGLAKEEAA